jgi:Asp-tRNA(Asn)/Glu-tRNA(Gln) amidotransferase A subunit family amidase
MKGSGRRGHLGLGARALAGAMARREISPVEVMRATLDRVASVNPGLTAIVSLRDREALMGEARLAEAALMSGAPQGWLTGVPVAVKDLADVKGMPTSCGAPFLAGRVAAADAGSWRGCGPRARSSSARPTCRCSGWAGIPRTASSV